MDWGHDYSSILQSILNRLDSRTVDPALLTLAPSLTRPMPKAPSMQELVKMSEWQEQLNSGPKHKCENGETQGHTRTKTARYSSYQKASNTTGQVTQTHAQYFLRHQAMRQISRMDQLGASCHEFLTTIQKNANETTQPRYADPETKPEERPIQETQQPGESFLLAGCFQLLVILGDLAIPVLKDANMDPKPLINAYRRQIETSHLERAILPVDVTGQYRSYLSVEGAPSLGLGAYGEAILECIIAAKQPVNSSEIIRQMDRIMSLVEMRPETSQKDT